MQHDNAYFDLRWLYREWSYLSYIFIHDPTKLEVKAVIFISWCY